MTDAPAQSPADASEVVVVLPSAILALCDAEAADWEAESDVMSFVAAIASDPTPQKIEAFSRQCFVEGAYRGAAKVAAEYRAQPLIASRPAQPPIPAVCAEDVARKALSKIASGYAGCDSFEDAQIIATEALSMLPGGDRGGWRTIDSAPTDGTKFDVWLSSGRRLSDVWWSATADRFECDKGPSEPHVIGGFPTHWMPLPEAPAALTSVGDGPFSPEGAKIPGDTTADGAGHRTEAG